MENDSLNLKNAKSLSNLSDFKFNNILNYGLNDKKINCERVEEKDKGRTILNQFINFYEENV